jgi:hypothetical protein
MAIFHIYDILKSNTYNNYLVNCNSDKVWPPESLYEGL